LIPVQLRQRRVVSLNFLRDLVEFGVGELQCLRLALALSRGGRGVVDGGGEGRGLLEEETAAFAFDAPV
jgi:hypothetical protein